LTMNLRRNLLSSKKGISTVFGMVFFILIVMIVFASFMIILNQNTSVQQTEAQANQADLARYQEMTTVSVVNPALATGTNVVFINCFVTDAGTLPTQLIRLWVRDNTTGIANNLAISPTITLQPGANIHYFNAISLSNVLSNHTISFWFVTTRGNDISASPTTSQLNTVTNGNLDSENSTVGNANTAITLSLTTKNKNDLIYLAVTYDDDGQISVASNPSLTWQTRMHNPVSTSNYQYDGGDSYTQLWYTIMPSASTITITLTQSNHEGDYYWTAMAFAVSNIASTTSPFDGSPTSATGDSGAPVVSKTTTNANDLVIGSVGIDWQNPVVTAGTGFTQVMGVSSTSAGNTQLTETSAPRTIWIESMNTNTTITGLSVNCAISNSFPWAIIADAVKLNLPTSPVTLSPTSGPVGEPVTVTGTDFAANSKLLATFGGSPISFSGTTDANGNINPGAVFTVPAGAAAGKNLVTITDSSFNTASTSFTVTTSNIALNPTTGSYGTTVTITGSNFISNSNMTITFDGNQVTPSTFPLYSDANGAFTTTFNVPLDTAGTKQVTASDGVNSYTTTFTFNPSINLSPTSGTIGSSVTIQGYGFAPSSSESVAFTFASSTLTTVPPQVFTNSSGCFSASFTVPSGYSAGTYTISANLNSNSATALFSIGPSITLNPTNGNVGQTVTVSGQGFAGGSALSATYAGTAVKISGTTTTTSTGTFNSVTFTVPTWTKQGAQTVILSDAATPTPNSASATFTPSTMAQPITVTMQNSAPIATVYVNGGAPSPTSFLADGNPHSITMVEGAPFNLSFTNSGNTRDGFSVSSAFSATSSQYTVNGGSVSLAAYEQVQNTFKATFSDGNPMAGDTLVLTGTYLGIPSSTILSLNVGGVSSASSFAWSDYGYAVTFSATTTKSGTTEQWAISSPYTISATALNPGGNSFSPSTNYYNQYSQTLSYTVVGGGSPSAPTATGTLFGSAYAPTLTNSATSYWFDASGSVTFSTVAGATGERWAPNPASILATAANTQVVSMSHQYQVTFSETGLTSDAGSNTVLTVGSNTYTYGSFTSGSLTAWENSGATYTWSTTVAGLTNERFITSTNTGTISSASSGDSAAYTRQYQVTFSQSGITSAAGSNTVLTLNGVNYAYNALPSGVWVNSGTTFSWVSTVSGGTGTQFVLSSSSGTSPITAGGTYSATYTAQYQVTFSETGLTSDAGSNTVLTVGSNTYTYGSFTSGSLTAWENSGATYTWSTTVAGLTNERFITSTNTGTISSASSGDSAAYTRQYQVTFSQSGITSAAGSNTVLTLNGVNYAYNALPSGVWVNSGTTFSWVSTVSGGTGTQFVLSSSSGTSPITAGGTYSATYTAQYQVTFQQSGLSSDASGTVLTVGSSTYTYSQLPLSNVWVNSGTTFSYAGTVSVSGGTKQYVLTGTSGLSSPISATGTATGTYKTQYYFTVSSAAGTPSGQSSGWYDSGTSITSSVSSTVDIAGPPIISYTSTGYTGTGSAPASGTTQTVTFTLNAASTVTWNWHGLMTLYPDGSGSNNIPSIYPTNGYSHWQAVSDYSAADSTAYVYVGSGYTGSYTDYYSTQSSGDPSGTINSVTESIRITTTSTSDTAQTYLRLNGVSVSGTAWTPSQTNTWTTHSDTLARPGGGSWSWTDIDNLQSGVMLTRNAGGSTIECTLVYVVVDFNA